MTNPRHSHRVTVVLGIALQSLLTVGAQGDDAPRIIAVMGFADTSADEQSQGFNRSLQEMLTTDLAVSRDVRVIERSQLEEVLAEQKLGKTEFLDQATAARVGKGLGAQAVLTGSVWVKDGSMRIDARLVHVETGEIILPEKVSGSSDSFLDLEKEIATKIIEALGARLSAFEKASFSRRHATDFQAAAVLGQALEAEDRGDAALARERAMAALEIDPQSGMAERIVREIDAVLDAVRAEDIRSLSEFVAAFELRLLDWPLPENPHLLPEYRRILQGKGHRQALLYWLENSQETLVGPFLKKPVSMIFTDPGRIADDRGPGRAYLELGAGEVIAFWCDLAQSDPRRTPRRPLTPKDLRPGAFAWLLPDIYTKRFMATVYCDGNFTAATRIAKEYAERCAAMGPEASLYPQLEQLRRQLSDPAEQRLLQQKIRENRTRWSIVHDDIVDIHYDKQILTFRRPSTNEPLSFEEVRKGFEAELLQNARHLQPYERAGFATNTVAQAVAKAAPSEFVAYPINDDNTALMFHVAGCPTTVDYLDTDLEKPLARAEDGVAKGMLPCGTCRPLRWLDARSARDHMSKIGSPLLEKALATQGENWPGGLWDFLGQFPDAPSDALRDQLVALAKAVSVAEGEFQTDRTRQRRVYQCVAQVADERDIEWLEQVLVHTPYFDVRVSAGCVLGCLGAPKVAVVLAKAIDQEPVYFVGHSLRASLARSLGTQWSERIDSAVSDAENGRGDAAVDAMVSLIDEASASSMQHKHKRRWIGALHAALGNVRRILDHPPDESAGDFRRALSFLPNDSPNMASVLNSLAYTLALQRKDLEEAESSVRKAIAIQRRLATHDTSFDDTSMLDTLALVLFARGNFGEAKNVAVECASRPSGQFLEVYDHLGDILWALNDHAAAKDAWQTGLSLANESAADAKRVRQVRDKLAR